MFNETSCDMELVPIGDSESNFKKSPVLYTGALTQRSSDHNHGRRDKALRKQPVHFVLTDSMPLRKYVDYSTVQY